MRCGVAPIPKNGWRTGRTQPASVATRPPKPVARISAHARALLTVSFRRLTDAGRTHLVILAYLSHTDNLRFRRNRSIADRNRQSAFSSYIIIGVIRFISAIPLRYSRQHNTGPLDYELVYRLHQIQLNSTNAPIAAPCQCCHGRTTEGDARPAAAALGVRPIAKRVVGRGQSLCR